VTGDVIAQLRARGADGGRLANLVEEFLAGGKALTGQLRAPRARRTAPRYWERDAALQAIAGHFKGSISAKAREVRWVVRRYDVTRWRLVDRHRSGEMPPGYRGTLDEVLFQALSAPGGKMPYSHSHLREIIGRSARSATYSAEISPPLISAAPKRTIRAAT
jgi:hypothetical protein